jgi:hypothetical protein
MVQLISVSVVGSRVVMEARGHYDNGTIKKYGRQYDEERFDVEYSVREAAERALKEKLKREREAGIHALGYIPQE